MIRPIPALSALLTACAVALWLAGPAAATSSTGGAGFGPTPGSTVTAQPANLTVSASADGMTIAAPESGVLRIPLSVSGSLPASDAGRTVDIELLGSKTGWTWQTMAQTQVRGDGSYVASWEPNHAGQFAVRAVVEQAGAVAATGLPTVTVIVYRPAIATLYGPGFWGHRTACGERLRRKTLGVANRTLPCGTPVALRYHGRMIVVPVIDRGPYANGASWDLTMATGKALGMYQTEKIGAAALPPTS